MGVSRITVVRIATSTTTTILFFRSFRVFGSGFLVETVAVARNDVIRYTSPHSLPFFLSHE